MKKLLHSVRLLPSENLQVPLNVAVGIRLEAEYQKRVKGKHRSIWTHA